MTTEKPSTTQLTLDEDLPDTLSMSQLRSLPGEVGMLGARAHRCVADHGRLPGQSPLRLRRLRVGRPVKRALVAALIVLASVPAFAAPVESPELVCKTLRRVMPLVRLSAKQVGVRWDVLGAIVWRESRGNSRSWGWEKDGDCSVGLGGVRVDGCDLARAEALLDPATNLAASAVILRSGYRWCRDRPGYPACRRARQSGVSGAVTMYSGGSTVYAKAIERVRKIVARCPSRTLEKQPRKR